MGIIQVPGRLSGKTYSVNIKGDTPSETEQARIRAYLDDQESAYVQNFSQQFGIELPTPDDGTALGRGLERGKASAKSLFGTTIETIGQQVGLPSIAEYGRGMEDAAAQRQFELSLLQPAPTTRQDVVAAEGFFPTIGAGLTYAGELAGEQLPQLGTSLAGGAVGAAVGSVGGPAGALAGFGIGSGLTEAPMLFGANVQRQEEEVAAGRKDAVDLTAALGSTVGQAGITAVTNALAGAGVFVRPGAKLFTRALSGAAVGGTTESLNEVGQQILERYQAGLPVDSPDAIQEYIDAGVAGGVLGVAAGGIGGAVGGPRPTEDTSPPAPPAVKPTIGQPMATPEEITAAAEEVAGEPAEIIPEDVRIGAGASTDNDLMEARGIYDERLAIALDSGASEEEAAQTAARVTVNYIDGLQEETKQRLARFRSTMDKRARASAGGVMQPDLPDTAYASEVSGTTQDSLFTADNTTQERLSVEPTVTPREDYAPVETDEEVFNRAAKLGTRTAAPVVNAPAIKPEQVLTDDLVTQLGVGTAKSAPLRKMVGKPLTDGAVIRTLDRWAQNDKATAENKALAARLITGQPAPEAPAIAPKQEAPNVPDAAAVKPEEVGVGVPSGEPSVEGSGGVDSIATGSTRTETPTGGGLGGDMSVPVGTDTAAGTEPTPLRIDRVDTTQLQGPDRPTRQLIPGTITPVDPSTLRPTGRPYPEASDVYAPDKAKTMSPAQRVTAQQLDEALAARYEALTPPDVKRGAKFLNERGVQATITDKLTIADKQVVINLLATRDDRLSPQAQAAKLYFSKVARPMEAVLMVVDDLTAPYGKYRAEPDADPFTRAFLSRTGTVAANQALDFIKTRMSKELNREVTFRQDLSAQQNKNIETWVDDLDRVERKRADRIRDRAARTEAAKESVYISEPMSTDPLAALDRALHYSVKMALDGGNLRLALRALSATTHNADLAALAARFADFTGTTRVKVLYPGDSAHNINSYPGIYWLSNDSSDSERTNIIYLNGQTGMSTHALMHEMAHAVTANLSYMQPNHPTIKQLESLLDFMRSKVSPPNLRGEYPTEFYGLTDLREFMAEAYGRVAMGANDNGLRDLMKRTEFVDYSSTQVELPLNALERFREIAGNLLRNLIGRPSKPYPRRTKTQTTKTRETGADRFHRLIDGLLSEAPHVLPDSVFQKAMSEPMVARTVLNNAIQNADPWSAAGRDRLSAQMQASIPMPARSMLLGLLQLDWFNDLAGKYFPQIAVLKQIDDLRRGELVQMEKRAERVLKDLLAYANTQPELYTTLMAIMGRATLAEVDPTKPRSTYNADPEKLRVWAALGNELRNSDSTGEMLRLFKTVRNMFAQFREDIKAVLSERVKEMTDDVATQNQLVARLLKKLDDENVIEPYFSLMRKGDFWLTYDADDTTAAAIVDPNTGVSRKPPTQFVQAFNSVWERDQFRAKLEATKDADGNPVARNFKDKPRPVGYNPDEKVPTAFAQGAINIITGLVPNMVDKAKGDAAVEAVMEMFSRFTPEHSILQSFNKRKGVRGFMGDITPIGVVDRPVDMVQALAEKSSSLAYQLMGMKYGARIQALKNQSDATLKTLLESSYLNAGEQQAVKAYHEEFKARANFAQRPRVSQFTQGLRGITFGMTLGFNVAAGFNTFAQIPMIGTTELAGRYGMPASMRELGSAARVIMNAGKTKRVRSFGPDGMELAELSSVDYAGSMDNYFEVNDVGEYVLRSDIKIPSKLRSKIANLDALVEVMSANGMLINSMSQEMFQADAGWLQTANKWSGFFQHHGERFNRQAMAIAAYNLELGKITGPISREAKAAAAKKAVEITERVNGSIGASTAPRWAMGPVGSVVFMFKRFGLHMARYIINTANQALRGASKEDRAVARYQIIGMLGTTALFAGVQGLPFFGEFMALVNLLFTDDDEEPAEVVIEKFLQEPFYHGALNYLTGAEIASRISMSGLIFRENKIEKDQSSLYDLFEMFGGPAVGVYMNTERGVDLLSQGELYRGVEAMMPAAIKGIMKSVRFATEGATTLRTDEIVPLSNLDIALQAIGYTPGAYARQQERVSGEKRINEAVLSTKRKLLRKYNLAFKDGDFSEVREVLKDIREFNKRHSEAQILPETLEQSSRSFLQSSQRMLGGVSFSPSYLPRAKQSVYEEYDQDISLWGSE